MTEFFYSLLSMAAVAAFLRLTVPAGMFYRLREPTARSVAAVKPEGHPRHRVRADGDVFKCRNPTGRRSN